MCDNMTYLIIDLILLDRSASKRFSEALIVADAFLNISTCADPEFCHIGSNSDNFFVVDFLVDERREDLNNTKSGPSSALQRNAISSAIQRKSMLAWHLV